MIKLIQKLIIILLSTVSLLGYGQDNKIELIITNATYITKTSNLEFELKVKNNSTKHISILKPKPDLFKNNYSFNTNFFVNLKKQKPYKLNITKSKKCNDSEVLRMPKKSNKAKLLTTNDFINIPSNEIINLGKVKLKLENEKFCENIYYKISVSYELELQKKISEKIKLHKKQENKINKIENELNIITKNFSLYRINFNDNLNEINKRIKLINKAKKFNTKIEEIKIKSNEFNMISK